MNDESGDAVPVEVMQTGAVAEAFAADLRRVPAPRRAATRRS